MNFICLFFLLSKFPKFICSSEYWSNKYYWHHNCYRFGKWIRIFFQNIIQCFSFNWLLKRLNRSHIETLKKLRVFPTFSKCSQSIFELPHSLFNQTIQENWRDIWLCLHQSHFFFFYNLFPEFLYLDHLFNRFANFSEKLIFLTPWYAHVRWRIRG